jgi:hypothetical protein
VVDEEVMVGRRGRREALWTIVVSFGKNVGVGVELT